MKLICNNCGYQYESAQERLPSKCPYCDKPGTLQRTKNMQDLIDEVSEEIP